MRGKGICRGVRVPETPDQESEATIEMEEAKRPWRGRPTPGIRGGALVGAGGRRGGGGCSAGERATRALVGIRDSVCLTVCAPDLRQGGRHWTEARTPTPR